MILVRQKEERGDLGVQEDSNYRKNVSIHRLTPVDSYRRNSRGR